jgi:hypothetical protein
MMELNGHHLHLVRGGAMAVASSMPTPTPTLDHNSPDRPTSEAAAHGAALGEEIHQIVSDAYKYGLQHGEPQHYKRGWRYGVLCGLLPGAVLFWAVQQLLTLAGLL